MPLIPYESKKLRLDTRLAIARANEILVEYEQQGYDLTLRQLFYQHVARGLIPNTERSYKNLGSVVSAGRMAGLIDWDHIVDRTRNMRSLAHWETPAEIIDGASKQYREDLWADQDNHVEVWIEKDALVGVVERACTPLDVPYFSCRGYTSQSEMWSASQRLLEHVEAGKHVTILHLGDHDPSGIDMTRDIRERLNLFIGSDYTRARLAEADIEDYQSDAAKALIRRSIREADQLFTVDRIALNMDQIRQYQPPPNPAKLSDSRSTSYIERFGDESWELDALEPTVMATLISDSVRELIEPVRWDAAIARQKEGRKLLKRASEQWSSLVDTLGEADDDDDE